MQHRRQMGHWAEAAVGWHASTAVGASAARREKMDMRSGGQDASVGA
jgi:hypothetical protein